MVGISQMFFCFSIKCLSLWILVGDGSEQQLMHQPWRFNWKSQEIHAMLLFGSLTDSSAVINEFSYPITKHTVMSCSDNKPVVEM